MEHKAFVMADYTKRPIGTGSTIAIPHHHKEYQLKTLIQREAYFCLNRYCWYQIVDDGEGPPSDNYEIHTIWVVE